MRIVNGVEREVIQSEWENWLADENLRCEQAGSMLKESAGKKDGHVKQQHVMESTMGREGLRKWHEEYCGSCLADQRALTGRREALV
jgi:hypothetical protein